MEVRRPDGSAAFMRRLHGCTGTRTEKLNILHHLSGAATGCHLVSAGDNYTEEHINPPWRPSGWHKNIVGHACYDPQKVGCEGASAYLAS